VLALAQQLNLAVVARLVNEASHRLHAICSHYVDRAIAEVGLRNRISGAPRNATHSFEAERVPRIILF
jgi:hypothetical protein